METKELETLLFFVETHNKTWPYVAYAVDKEGKEIPCLGGVGQGIGDLYDMIAMQLVKFFPELKPKTIEFVYPTETVFGSFSRFMNQRVLDGGRIVKEEPLALAGVKDKELVECIYKILNEYDRAKEKHPDWPTNVVYRASIVSEEVGELVREANLYAMEGTQNRKDILKEAIHTAATALRFIREFETISF